MRAWEKAKEKYPALSRMDFIVLTCPTQLGLIFYTPAYCRRPYAHGDQKWRSDCAKCWDREVTSNKIGGKRG